MDNKLQRRADFALANLDDSPTYFYISQARETQRPKRISRGTSRTCSNFPSHFAPQIKTSEDILLHAKIIAEISRTSTKIIESIIRIHANGSWATTEAW
jgi:hypothetical protein